MPHTSNIVPQNGKNHREIGSVTVSNWITRATRMQIWNSPRQLKVGSRRIHLKRKIFADYPAEITEPGGVALGEDPADRDRSNQSAQHFKFPTPHLAVK